MNNNGANGGLKDLNTASSVHRKLLIVRQNASNKTSLECDSKRRKLTIVLEK